MGSNPLFWTMPNGAAARAAENQQQQCQNGYMSGLDAANASSFLLDQIIGNGCTGEPTARPCTSTETGTIIEGECEEVKPAPLLTFDNP